MNNLTFQEKSHWASLASMVVVYSLYYINVIPPVDGNMESPHIWQFFKYMGLLVVVVATGHVFILIKSKQEPEDERQKMIEMKADRVSAYILHIGIVVAMWVPGNFWIIHTLTIIAVLTDVANKIQQLRLFNRGY